MANLPHKESYPSISLNLNLFNAENVGVSVKHGYYEQFYPQKPLSENIHFQIYSNEDYFLDFSSRFIDLHLILRKLTMKCQVLLIGYPMKIMYCIIYFDISIPT